MIKSGHILCHFIFISQGVHWKKRNEEVAGLARDLVFYLE